MKKILAAILSICMVLAVFGGCSSSTNKSSTANSSENISSQSTLTKAEQAIADRKASGKYPKVTMAAFTWTAAPSGTSRVNAALNKITEEKIGVDIDLQITDFATYRQNIPLMLTSGESLDLFQLTAIGFSNAVNNGYMYDMNENDLIKTYGAEILNTLDKKYIDAGTVNDSLYALTTVRDIAASPAIICVGAQYLDGIGYDYNSKWSDSNKETITAKWSDLETIFAQLKAKYPDKAVLTGNSNWLTQCKDYDNLAGDWYGVLMDPVNSLKVTDVFESDEFKKDCQMFYQYNQKGYFPGDVLTTTVGSGPQVAAGTAMIEISQGKPGYRTQVSTECSQDMIPFQVGTPIVKSSSATGVAWALNQNSKDPIAAMQFLDLCYTDAEVSNILCWGEEGVDYTVNEKGTIQFPAGVDVKNAQFNHGCQWEMPNECISHVWYTNSSDLWQRTIDFNNKARVSKALGFVWNNSEYKSQFTALQNVYDEYFKGLMSGSVNPDTTIPEFIEKLKASGLDEYITAKQKALDAWAQEKGIS